MTATLAELITTHGVTVDDHLDRQLHIPILTGMQRQGDVLVLPSPGAKPATTPVPAAGTPVVRGENGGNTHAIVGPNVYCDVRTATADDLHLATLTVPGGEVAYIMHPEHGANGIGPGTYALNRQREQADQLRMVQD
jgi:hypothetical protein